MPALNAAISALDTLSQKEISLVKTMTNPPSGVRLVTEAICIMKVSYLTVSKWPPCIASWEDIFLFRNLVCHFCEISKWNSCIASWKNIFSFQYIACLFCGMNFKLDAIIASWEDIFHFEIWLVFPVK